MSFARVRVDLNALASNYSLFQDHTVGEVGAVVKANGYGLGAIPIAKRLDERGCRSFFVATLDEALAIRSVVRGEIFVFEPPLGADGLKNTIAARCIPVINDASQLSIAIANGLASVAVHVDTGMARLGIPYDTIDLEQLRKLKIRLLLTHLACADEPNHPFNMAQIKRFQAITAKLPSVRTSIGNSAGTLNGRPFQGDVVRPGIGLYGANPFSDRKNPTSIVATCEAQVLSIRAVDAEEGIGYGLTHTTTKPTRLAVLGMGYADGIPRVLSNVGNFACRDQLLPIRGRISMDLTQIDVTDCADLKVGDWVEFFGSTIDVDDVAAAANSFGYEFLTNLGDRVERLYV